MKKVGIDMMLGRRTRCHFRKLTPKTTIVKANLPVGVATKSLKLGSILGQYGLNAEDFCTFFNKNSQLIWKKGTIIPVIILISPTKTYILEYQLPTVYSIFDKVFNFNIRKFTYFQKSINRKTLIATAYKIAVFKSQSENPQILHKWVRQIIGSLRSYNLVNILRKSKVKFNWKKRRNK